MKKGEHKHVNVDQLKKVQRRDIHLPTRLANQVTNNYTDIFDNEINDEVVIENDRARGRGNGSWCNVNRYNILQNRTRSGGGGIVLPP